MEVTTSFLGSTEEEEVRCSVFEECWSYQRCDYCIQQQSLPKSVCLSEILGGLEK